MNHAEELPLYRLHDRLRSETVPFVLWGRRRHSESSLAEMGPTLDAAVGLLMDLAGGQVENCHLQTAGSPARNGSPHDPGRLAENIAVAVRDLQACQDLEFACWLKLRGEQAVRCYCSPDAPLLDAIGWVADAINHEIELCVGDIEQYLGR